MNIFYLDHNPIVCSAYHVDKHVVKMILEYSQLLSTAHRILDGTQTTIQMPNGKKKKIWLIGGEKPTIRETHKKQRDGSVKIKFSLEGSSGFYLQTHSNHPSAVWVRQSMENYIWLSELLKHLTNEYTYRYGKIHKCDSSGLVDKLRRPPINIPTDNLFTEPTPAMPEEYIVPGDSIQSYKNYYVGGKTHLANWSRRETPPWYK